MISSRETLQGWASEHQLEVGAGIDFQLPPSSVPSIARTLVGRTSRDAEVDRLEIPSGPFWLRLGILSLRYYRKIRPDSIGKRCLWDPSCSRYAELALRERGPIRGVLATVRRLVRCRPGYGGIDMP